MGGKNLSRPMKESKTGACTKKTHTGAPITNEFATRPTVSKVGLENKKLILMSCKRQSSMDGTIQKPTNTEVSLLHFDSMFSSFCS